MKVYFDNDGQLRHEAYEGECGGKVLADIEARWSYCEITDQDKSWGLGDGAGFVDVPLSDGWDAADHFVEARILLLRCDSCPYIATEDELQFVRMS